MIKKLFYVFGLFFVGSFGFAAQVLIEPQFSDSRFPPTDKLHAGCTHTAKVSIKTSSKEDISSFRFVLSYEPQKIEILDVKPSETYKGSMDSKIEYDKIIVSLVNKPIPKNTTTELFSLSFKSNEFASGTSLVLHKPSYVVGQNNEEILVFAEQKIAFEKVVECDPDILPPTITLIKPQNTSQLLKVDTVFIFTVNDTGKGIDKESISLEFDGNKYSGLDSAFMWSGDQLSFYPKTWIPSGKKVSLTLSIGDKQAYGGPNIISKTFSFSSHSGIVFENGVTPTMFRNLLGNIEDISASTKECAALDFLVTHSPEAQFPLDDVESLSKKIGCVFYPSSISSSLDKTTENTQTNKGSLSVFSLLGWILFIIVFILKLHYFVSYRQHKKLSKSLQASESKQ